MPYKLRITKEEVENELTKLGLHDLTEESIEGFRKDLLKLIKNDLRKLKQQKKENELKSKEKYYGIDKVDRVLRFPTTSTPSLALDQELEKEKEPKVRERRNEKVESEYETYSSCVSSEATSLQASSLSSESSEKLADEKFRKKKEKPTTTVSVRKREKVAKEKQKSTELPSYPEKPDPVNLYHFYKAHWDKHKVPGEDPRNALRWEIRSKLFYS